MSCIEMAPKVLLGWKQFRFYRQICTRFILIGCAIRTIRPAVNVLQLGAGLLWVFVAYFKVSSPSDHPEQHFFPASA
jgi:hypothetical protein